MLSAEDLLAGGTLHFDVVLPPNIVRPGAPLPTDDDPVNELSAGGANTDSVRLKPLTVNDLQLIARAAKESDDLAATLMVHRSLVTPEMNVGQVAAMHAGLLQFLLSKVQEISGITIAREDIDTAVADPLAKAAFVLAREFGWTPQQVNDLTLGQILLNLKMLQSQDDLDESTSRVA